ncbi:MAG TPA: class I SAM-dependent methyltransferase [Terriglobia bacterium]|nr:class I SAM-dependent methyltransferase [Terriglobia bacterium]
MSAPELSTGAIEYSRFIESLNACGPFNHGHWNGRGIRVSHEDELAGRADFLVRRIRETVCKTYSAAELAKMTIADVGCYDGWILHHLSDLPFKKLVGIEPRSKNITKGRDIRKLLGIKTRVKFRQEGIESLGKERFDVVICIGVLHHLECIATAMKQLDRITRQMLLLGSICMPSRYLTEEMKQDIEPKDVIYRTKTLCGFSGQKYESRYYDGSAAETGIVSIPSIETLKMHCDLLGYEVKVVASPAELSRARQGNTRPFQEVLLCNVRNVVQPAAAKESLAEYERGLLDPLDRSSVEPLYRHFVLAEKDIDWTSETVLIRDYITSGTTANLPNYQTPNKREIIKNLRWNPVDKIGLEYGKILFSENRYPEAIVVLQTITQKVNADWRAVYRSFYLLSEIYLRLGNKRERLRYRALCAKCHPLFPLLSK